LRNAVAIALRANLGAIDATQEHDRTRAARIRALSALLPHIGVETEAVYRNLVADSLGVPKLGLPHAVPAFSYQTAHVTYQQNALDIAALFELRSANEEVAASAAETADARNIVVLASVSSYLLVAASQTRLETAKAQLATATTAHALLASRVKRELSPEIEEIRARVAMRSSALRVTLAETTLEKDKLALTRIIGLPIAQEFELSDGLEYSPLLQTGASNPTETALENRQDIKAAHARLRAAEESVNAAKAQYLPQLDVRANAGETGITYGHPYRDYAVEGKLSIPIFTGRRIEAGVQAAKATLERRKAEFADTKARAVYDVRTAQLNLSAARTSVEVADENRDLAQEGLRQARDRFNVGVSTVVDLLQAQQAVAEAEDNKIASVYAHQLAKLMLIRAYGTAEQDFAIYMGVH
jgi:outer membrane protein TolC